ncbi:MAG TPA: nitrile hydratase accessory protein, partial [Acidobacteriota bacterium]
MTGAAALPRRSGELVFHDEWERRVFAMAVALCEQGLYSWDDFRTHLIAAIAVAGETPAHPKPDAPGYFEHWLASFERVLAEKDILSTDPARSPAAGGASDTSGPS